MPNLFPITYLYNDCKISNIKSLRIMHVFAVIFKYINTINSLTHNYNTRFVKDINIALPKLRTAFGQLGPYFVFTQFCIKHKICIHDYISFKQVKIKPISLDLNNIEYY